MRKTHSEEVTAVC